jgi:hypothetical protein
VAVTRGRGRDADEDERADAGGVVECEPLHEHPACRDAYDVRGRDAIGVEHARGVGDDVSKASWRGT